MHRVTAPCGGSRPMGRCARAEGVGLAEAAGRAAKRSQEPARTRRAKRVPSQSSSLHKPHIIIRCGRYCINQAASIGFYPLAPYTDCTKCRERCHNTPPRQIRTRIAPASRLSLWPQGICASPPPPHYPINDTLSISFDPSVPCVLCVPASLH